MAFTDILNATLAELQKNKQTAKDQGKARLAQHLGVTTEAIRLWGKGKLPFSPKQEFYANKMQEILTGKVKI